MKITQSKNGYNLGKSFDLGTAQFDWTLEPMLLNSIF